MSDLLDLKNDSRRISSIAESPCTSCIVSEQCDARIAKNSDLAQIKYVVYGDKCCDVSNCPLFIALTAPEMIEVEQ